MLVVNFVHMTHIASKMSDFNQFFITMYWLRQYPTMHALQAMFGIHARSLIRFIHRILQACKQAWKDEVRWPSDIEMKKYIRIFTTYSFHDNRLHGIVCVANGTDVH